MSRRGFTLIEVVVALAILGISLGLAMRLISASLHKVRLIAEHSSAVALADSKMSELLLDDEAAQPGELVGVFDENYRWRALIEELPPEEVDSPQVLTKLLRIRLDVYWLDRGREQAYSLETLKIVPNPQFAGPLPMPGGGMR